jgi:SAM-dependent methyltransferase
MADLANMGAAAQDYVTDVPYLRTFSNDLSPASLRCAVALNGFATPAAHDFDYLELGSGNGDTLITLAAAYPHARFVGIDINREHVAFARELAGRVDLQNVRFIEGDFEQLAREDFPDFDFVSMWGLLSWISPQKRKAAIEFAGAKLRKGGLLFASYNAMPGWSAVEPLRRLMLDAATDLPSSLERANRGLGVAKLLDDAGAHYFTNNPAARAMLATALSSGLAYAVHEYFLPHWHPMYFEDVAREMAASGIHFVGQLPLFCNYRDLVIPASLRPLFNGVTDRVGFERLKDYALNEFFRRDIFMKGECTRADETTRVYLDSTYFGTLVSADQVKRSVKLPNYTLQFVGPIFDELIPSLATRACTVSELVSTARLAPYGAQQLRNAVLHLALAEQVSPMQLSVPQVALPTPGPFRASLAHNRMTLAQPLTPQSLVVLACPATGGGFVVSAVEVVCIRALAVEPSQRGEWLRMFVAKQPVKLQVQGEGIEDFEAQVSVLAGEIELFCNRRLPKLIQLGILQQAAHGCRDGIADGQPL